MSPSLWTARTLSLLTRAMANLAVSVGHSGARASSFLRATQGLFEGGRRSAAAGPLSPALELFNINFGPNSCAVLAKILNVVLSAGPVLGAARI